MKKRTVMGRLMVVFLALGLSTGCESDPSSDGEGAINSQARLSSLTGKMAFLNKNAKARVSLKVGNQKFPATLNNGRFTFNNIPAGPKSLLLNDGKKTIPLKFNLDNSGKKVSIIPDAPMLSGGALDLGVLRLGKDALGGFLEPSNNPLVALDSDGDGENNYIDPDIDGDGIANGEDGSPMWNDDWAGSGDWEGAEWLEEWGWEEEIHSDDWDDDWGDDWEGVCYLDEGTGAEICEDYDWSTDDWESYCEDYDWDAEDSWGDEEWDIDACDSEDYDFDEGDYCDLPEFVDDPECSDGWFECDPEFEECDGSQGGDVCFEDSFGEEICCVDFGCSGDCTENAETSDIECL